MKNKSEINLNWKEWEKRDRGANKGFTLVELIICFVILLILSGAGVAGVLEYQDYADFKRQNSYAQTLFSAAQSEMTALSVRGQSGELIEAGMGTRMSGEVQVYYLLGDAQSYEKYKNGNYEHLNDKLSKGYKQLYGLFDSYLYDKGILRAAIAVEYNPVDGTVYSVFYSDKVTSFNYSGKNGNGKADISVRDEKTRRKNLVGYYGVE